ncbi:hypothetical protein [Roseomonas sp. KE0001]|nr:hypothetical protein [Roseomonas sp. KE0001]
MEPGEAERRPRRTPAGLVALMRRDRAIWEPIVRNLGLTAQ